MDGRIGPITILPDQMNIFNSLSVLITILLFEAWVYPAVNKIFTLTPLRKIAIGGILTGIAFVMSGLLQLRINETLEPSPADGYAYLQIVGRAPSEFFAGGIPLKSGRNVFPTGLIELTSAGGQRFNLTLSPNDAYAMSAYRRDGDK